MYKLLKQYPNDLDQQTFLNLAKYWYRIIENK